MHVRRAQLVGVAAGYPNARLIALVQQGVSLSRNAGALDAGYNIYINDDAVPASDWVERIIAPIQEAPRPAEHPKAAKSARLSTL